jgi:hypothetical protein
MYVVLVVINIVVSLCTPIFSNEKTDRHDKTEMSLKATLSIPPVSSTAKTYSHDITEILLRVALLFPIHHNTTKYK